MAARRPGTVMRLQLLIGRLLRLINALAALTAAELQANAGQLRAGVGILVIAAALLLAALTLVLVAGVLALAHFVGVLAACLITAAVAALAGWALASHALARLGAIDLAPRRAIATLHRQVDRMTAKAAPAKGVRDDDASND